MKSLNNFIAAAAVIIFPASVITVDNLSGLVMIVAVLIGVGQMIYEIKKILPISSDEKLFFLR